MGLNQPLNFPVDKPEIAQGSPIDAHVGYQLPAVDVGVLKGCDKLPDGHSFVQL